MLLIKITSDEVHIKGNLPKARMAMKKPIAIKVREISEPFQVQTLEGVMEGKAGDFLMTGVQGEMYPCDREIFFETYDWVEDND